MRQSGVLMHITSLPGKYGIGTMGSSAMAFIDFLKEAGQSLWQILPLTPTGYGDSPYQSCSTYAGNHYLIDLDDLIAQELLTAREAGSVTWCTREDKVDFGLQYNHKLEILSIAYSRFQGGEEFEAFRRENESWLPDYCLFMALKEESGGKPWYSWEKGLKFRDPEAVWAARQRLKDRIRFYGFTQYEFFRQWGRLKAYANKNGISVLGDVPIYVPLDSVDVWSAPEFFQLNADLEPVAVAGCPPDGFTEDGQLWGNPLYRWDVLEKDGFGWWIRRLAGAGKLYDLVRMDHFRGIEAYWAVPYGDKTARGGKWIKGPGMALIRAIREQLPGLKMIAEDLGYLTPEVLKLRDQSGYPGMKVLGFAFDSREPSEYLPHTYPTNSVCYTGTHDNMTTRQWLDTAPEDAVRYAKEYMALTEEEGLVWGIIRTAMSSVSDLCVIPMQDLLDLGGEARMNFPGSLSDSNWTWRGKSDIINLSLAKRLRGLTRLYGRLGKQAETAHAAVSIG